MSYSYKCYSDTKDIMKKYVNAVEGAAIYGLGKTRIMALAKEAGAVYKVGNSALINTEIFESYLEKFREPSKKLPGATFKVTAGADIYKADRTKVYNAGDVVAESLTTGTDGQVVLSDLHLGTYVVTEMLMQESRNRRKRRHKSRIEHRWFLYFAVNESIIL